MTLRYTRSTDGSDADNGTTWALAKATLAGVAAIDAAADRLWVSQAHAESTAAGITIAIAGTIGVPSEILCGNDGAEPPVALATTGQVTTTGTSNIALTGSFYCYGLIFTAGSGGGSSVLTLCDSAANNQVYESCDFIIGSTGGSGAVYLGSQSSVSANAVTLNNCRVKFAGIAQNLSVGCRARINGGSIIAGGTNVTNFIGGYLSNRGIDLVVTGFDFTNLASTSNLMLGGAVGNIGRAIFRDCTMPPSWSGSLMSAAISTAGFRAEMHNCDSADTNYRFWIEDYTGSIKSEIVIVRTSGATDNTTPLSWKMASSAGIFPQLVLSSQEFWEWNDTTGSSKTATVEIVHDSVTALTDAEVWLEIIYPGTSGKPLGTIASDKAASVIATPADQTTSSATWTTTGLTNPNKQKLEVMFTPTKKGPIIARVCMSKSSKTIYVDPLLTIS